MCEYSIFKNLAPSWHHLTYSAWLAAAGGGPGAPAAEAGAWPWFGVWMIGNIQVNALWSCVDRSSLISLPHSIIIWHLKCWNARSHRFGCRWIKCWGTCTKRVEISWIAVSMLFRFGETILVVLVWVVLGAWCILRKDLMHSVKRRFAPWGIRG